LATLTLTNEQSFFKLYYIMVSDFIVLNSFEPTIRFCGAAGMVTGSCYFVEVPGRIKFLVECGFFQGSREIDKLNYRPFSFDPQEIELVLLTHGHLDHCGLLPKLYREGFRGRVISTPGTFAIAQSILSDSAHIQEHGAKREQIPLLFDRHDARGVLNLFVTYKYGQSIDLAKGIKAIFYDAGHILGSSIIHLKIDKLDIIFSGDLGNLSSPILKDPVRMVVADYVLCESTYGGRNHPPVQNRRKELKDAITYILQSQGKLFIPAFAVQRTQDILYELNRLFKTGAVPALPVFLDSPLAIRVTETYKEFYPLFDANFQKILKTEGDPLSFPSLVLTSGAHRSRKLISRRAGPAVIIAGSGMADAGRIQNHFIRGLPDKRNMALFVGFQVEGTPGKELIDGARKIRIMGKNIAVKAKIRLDSAFSAHADHRGLMNWLSSFETNPKIILIHGEDEARVALRADIKKNLGLPVVMPKLDEEMIL